MYESGALENGFNLSNLSKRALLEGLKIETILLVTSTLSWHTKVVPKTIRKMPGEAFAGLLSFWKTTLWYYVTRKLILDSDRAQKR